MWRNAYIVPFFLLFALLFGFTNRPFHGGEDNVAIHLFYLMDEKYPTTKDSTAIFKWIDQKLQQVENGFAKNDISGHKGPGPNGSQWNPSNDLLIVPKAPYIYAPNSSVTIHFNDKDPRYSLQKSKNEDLLSSPYYYILKKEKWDSLLNPVTQKDIELVYGKNYEKDVENGEQSAELVVGQFLEISVNIKGQKGNTIFHAAFGE